MDLVQRGFEFKKTFDLLNFNCLTHSAMDQRARRLWESPTYSQVKLISEKKNTFANIQVNQNHHDHDEHREKKH